MCDSEFIYKDYEECSSSKKSSQDNFITNEVKDALENALENARLLLDDENDDNNYDDGYEENDTYEDNDENFSDVNDNINDDDDDESIDDNDDNNNINVEHEQTPIQNLTPCVVIDSIDGEIKRCNGNTRLQRLQQMTGTWEIDTDAANNNSLHQLEICFFHMTLDQNQLHSSGAKQKVQLKKVISVLIFVFFAKKKSFFSCGGCCKEHSLKINRANVQIPCICIFKCPAFTEELIAHKSFSGYRARYICTKYFQKQSGHIYKKPGRGKIFIPCTELGKHLDDTSNTLADIGRWIISIEESLEELPRSLLIRTGLKMAKIDSNKLTENLLKEQLLLLLNNKKNKEIEVELSSSLLIKTTLKIAKIDPNKLKEKYYNITSKNVADIGEKMGKKILSLRSEIQLKKIIVQQRKQLVVNKKRNQRGLSLKSLNTNHITKVTTFITSMFLTMAFPKTKIWLTHIILSLYQNPKLLPKLRKILYSANIIFYTKQHEYWLAKLRMFQSNPVERIIKGPNIWNLAVIDNIDFKASTFVADNIFDVGRKTSHATLRMVFQFILPTTIPNITDNELIGQLMFGESTTTNYLLKQYETVFNTIIEKNKNKFKLEDVHLEIMKKIPSGSNIPVNVIIRDGQNGIFLYYACAWYAACMHACMHAIHNIV
ncbi:hypothetical protein C2G38_2226467 [Gigaspora rosea]|uniref:Uncharacterized protein n=1 Tax=Gigaspora rosea TaxID=44941 RepID=A0A397U6H4_9GLOM|nr:hypothetical protein C2G38_2226467 [Gigaspora rosea]